MHNPTPGPSASPAAPAALGNGSAVRQSQAGTGRQASSPVMYTTTGAASTSETSRATGREGLTGGGGSGPGVLLGHASLQQEPMSRGGDAHLLATEGSLHGLHPPGGLPGVGVVTTDWLKMQPVVEGNAVGRQSEAPNGTLKRSRQDDPFIVLMPNTAPGSSQPPDVFAVGQLSPPAVAHPPPVDLYAQQPEVIHSTRRARWDCTSLCPGARMTPATEATPMIQEQEEVQVGSSLLSSCLGSSGQGQDPAMGASPGTPDLRHSTGCTPVQIMLCMPQVSAPFATCLRAKAPREKQSQ